MKNNTRTIQTVDLSSEAERRFEASSSSVGGKRADVDLEALHTLMCATVELLSDIDAALIAEAKPIIRDRLPRA